VDDLIVGLKFAFSYFSILPVRLKGDEDLSGPGVLGAMLFFFPLVGFALGAGSVGIYWLLAPLGWLGAVVAALALMMGYGFLHTEAVMDVADAVYGAYSGKDPYEIIKDPTVGAMGVLWGVAAVMLKVAGISYLLLHHLFAVPVAIGVLSRLALLMLIYTREFRSSFLTQLKSSLSRRRLAGAILLYGGIGLAAMGMPFAVLSAIAFGISYAAAGFFGRRLGFLNGDVLGASLELTEISLLLIGAALWC